MTSAILVAAGKGTRMALPEDKLFLQLAGSPVIAHSWRSLDSIPEIVEIIVVIRPEVEKRFQDLADRQSFSKPYRFVAGGKERQDSVWNGVQAAAPGSEIVLVHDAARPCATPELIVESIRAAERTGAAVAAQKISDTIKKSLDGKFIGEHLDRNQLCSVQTPQTFQKAILIRALTALRESGALVTDDTAACGLIGQAVELVFSNSPNPKVTIPEDLPFLEFLLKRAD